MDAWNEWREEHRSHEARLQEVDLSGKDLTGVDFHYTDLSEADLSGANLAGARLSQSTVNDAKLVNTNLANASLNATHFIESNLKGAVLDRAEIAGTDFNRGTLVDVSFHDARFFEAVLTDVDLTGAKGLESCTHEAPSIIDSRTLALSGGLPDEFLRGCGLPDWLIEAYSLMQPELSNEEVISIAYRLCNKRIGQVMQFSPLFISYSHDDEAFVDLLADRFDERGIRYWRDTRHATAGRMERIVDRAIRLNPTVLLVLSQSAVESDWVEHEARVARRLEKELDRDVMCPIALDDSWKHCDWPARLREQIEEYHILDFSKWRDEDAFEEMFERLLRGLSLFYEAEQSAPESLLQKGAFSGQA